MYIRFQVKSRIQNLAKMFRNVRRTCWNKYVDKLEQKLNERILPTVPVPSSKEDIDVLVKDGCTVRYDTPQFLLRSTVHLFCNGTGTLRWYGTPFL